MISVAIIEDNQKEAERLKVFFSQFSKESGQLFHLKHYKDALFFLADEKIEYDIVLMDIELPDINGIEAAKQLRERDKQIVIIFVTNMAQFAVKGYEVNALDFVVKPIAYAHFVLKIQKAITIVNRNRLDMMSISVTNGLRRVAINDICFIEVKGHSLYYHLPESVISTWGSLTKIEVSLKPYHFLRCHNRYLINPFYIQTVSGNEVVMMDGQSLKISQPRKKQFLQELAEYFGDGNL